MANNYQQYSEVIDNLTPVEVRWWKDKIEWINKYNDKVNEWNDEVDGDIYKECLYPDGLYPGDLDLENDSLWIVAHESGDLEIVAMLVQDFLKECCPDGCFSLTWADTCSKMRVSEFSGGGIFVTAKEIQWFSPHMEIARAKDKFLASQA